MRGAISKTAAGWTMVLITAAASPAAAQMSEAAQETTIPGGTLVLAVYMVLWVLFGGYVFAIMRRQRKLQHEIDALDARIDEVLGGPAD